MNSKRESLDSQGKGDGSRGDEYTDNAHYLNHLMHKKTPETAIIRT
jgi:hypothetical protein